MMEAYLCVLYINMDNEIQTLLDIGKGVAYNFVKKEVISRLYSVVGNTMFLLKNLRSG